MPCLLRRRVVRLAAYAALPLAASHAHAQMQAGPILLAPMFQDHGVLQRDRAVPIWGRALPGEEVTIEIGTTRISARADRSGAWRAVLPAMAAGGPLVLTASTPRGARQTVRDLLVGDVWLCSGQSNMEYPVSRALNGAGEIAAATDSRIRLLKIGHAASQTPMTEFKTPVRWDVASPHTVGDFSAVCYFTGRSLRMSEQVPIGLIDASWGGTAIDAWRSDAAIATDPSRHDARAINALWRRDSVAGVRRWGAIWEEWWRAKTGDKPGGEPWQSGAPGDWAPVPAFTNWESWGVAALAEYNGIVWYTTEVALTPAQAAQPATLTLGPIDESDQDWVNGVPVGNSFDYSNPRSYRLAPGVLKPGVNRVTVAVLDTYGAGGMGGDADSRAIRLADGSSVPLSGGWRYRIAPGGIGNPPPAPWGTATGLSGIYNGMIAPLGAYALKGAIWYQGESDAGAADGYAARLASLVADWRAQFGRPDLPFVVVQLASWGPRNAAPVESGSARIRDEQRRAVAADPRMALVVAWDLGEPNDIHPANKQTVALRAARAARAIAYGAPVAPSGPQVARARRDTAGDIRIAFTGVDGALVAYSGAAPTGFELCGAAPESCRFVTARIDGTHIVLSPEDGAATRVRYCWGDSPICTLYDRAGMPAGPFERMIE
ncbi:MAG: sialate O-acetylesterase [Pseudomonadota bacterium]